MLLTIPTQKPSGQELSVSAEEASFLVHTAGHRPSSFSPLQRYADAATVDRDALGRAGRALEHRGVLVQTREGLTLRAPWGSSAELLFAPAAVVDVVFYRRPGETLLRSTFWADGGFLVACDARVEGMRCSVPVARARWASTLSAWVDPGASLPWRRSLEPGLFKLCALLAPTLAAGSATVDALAEALEGAGLDEHGPPADVLRGLVSAELLTEQDAAFFPDEDWAPLWESLSVPETLVLSVEYADGASDEELWIGPRGARCRVQTERAESGAVLWVSRPGASVLRERLLTWTDLVPVEGS